MISKKQYIRIVAIFLMVVIALPLIIQPAHYLFIKHDHHHGQSENTINQEDIHLSCAIDNFHFTEISLHGYIYKARIVRVFTIIKILLKPVFSKQETTIPFSLRAPPYY